MTPMSIGAPPQGWCPGRARAALAAVLLTIAIAAIIGGMLRAEPASGQPQPARTIHTVMPRR